MKIMIVDDHQVVLHGLRSAIESHGHEVVAAVSTIKQAQAFLTQKKPDAIVVDINLPDGSGFELVTWCRKISPKIAIVVLTLNDTSNYLQSAKLAGANAFVVKDAPLSELLASLDFALKAPQSFSSNISIPLETDYGLSSREIDVLHSINHGLSNAAIASKLFISESTVKSHVSAILQKLNVKNRVQAISVARKRGLLL
jgi:DNA-binding NarL/FixJ family response regulator